MSGPETSHGPFVYCAFCKTSVRRNLKSDQTAIEWYCRKCGRNVAAVIYSEKPIDLMFENETDRLRAEVKRLRKVAAAARKTLETALPDPSNEPKSWTARMQGAWNDLRAALEEKADGKTNL